MLNFFKTKKQYRIFFDEASVGTPSKASVFAFLNTLKLQLKNPSSIHKEGEIAKNTLFNIRKGVAETINCKRTEIYFPASVTEANNIFIKGAILKRFKGGKKSHIITLGTEHNSILETVNACKIFNTEISFAETNDIGKVSVENILKLLQTDTVLIVLSLVNSENGTKQHIREIAQKVREYAIQNNFNIPYIFVDATQAPIYEMVEVSALLCDGLSMSSQKIGGIFGTALLYIKNGVELEPLINGGGQERGVRSGTENIGGANALLVSLKSLGNKDQRQEKDKKVSELKVYLIKKINELNIKLEKNNLEVIEILSDKKYKEVRSGSNVFYYFDNSLPHITLLRVPNILGEELVLRLDAKNISVSTSSACSLLEGSGSHLLLSKGETEKAKETIRISFGINNTKSEIDCFVAVLEEILHKYSIK